MTIADPTLDTMPTFIIAQLRDSNGEDTGPQLQLPTTIGPSELHQILNKQLSNDDPIPYTFSVDRIEIRSSIEKDLIQEHKWSLEQQLIITYHPQAIFKVRQVTRCSATMAGHTEAILAVRFSPDGTGLATASGDGTVRLWDLSTSTPLHQLLGHKGWVLCVEWAPNGEVLVSGSMDHSLRIWDPINGICLGILNGHKKWITGFAFQPHHLNKKGNRMASSSKDCTTKIWDLTKKICIFTFGSHTCAVTSVRWGDPLNEAYSEGVVYTGSQDRCIKLWNPKDGTMIMNLSNHSHWINSLSLNTDYVIRTGPFDHTGQAHENKAKGKDQALKRFNDTIKLSGGERLCSASDDFTIFLWPKLQKINGILINFKPIARLTGHQKPVNHVLFSPDGQYLSSGSFDNSIKIWCSRTGKFLFNMRSHVAPVYQLAWSPDSRLLVSASKDATAKVWSVKTKKMVVDLPSHRDEVFAIDWSPIGEFVASGSKDKTLKIWRN